jgi:Cdc6-like AAA superfamily ATPase
MAKQHLHLSATARKQLELGNEDRITAIYQAKWVPHPRAKRALDRLNFLYRYPKCARMQCLLIYGESGIGKTMVLEKFMREHSSAFDSDAGMARIPVVYVQMPPAPDEKRFYSQMMAAVGGPSAPDERLHRLEGRTLRLYKQIAPRVIVIDEVHHLLSGTGREQRRSLNLLKFIANELRICIVTVGTSDALLAMQTDQQVASRFEPCEIPRWGATNEFRSFLSTYAKGLPLHEPSEITDRESVNILLSRTDGITGRITLVLARAAEMAITRGAESISAEWIEKASRDLDLAPLRVA